MRMISRAWFVAFLGMVFAIGGFSGVLADRVWLLRRQGAPVVGGALDGPGRRGRAADRAVEAQLSWLDRQVDLSDEQRRVLADLLRQWQERAARLQIEVRRRFVDEQASLRAEIEATLTPNQVQRFRDARGGPFRRGGPLADPGRPRGPRGPE